MSNSTNPKWVNIYLWIVTGLAGMFSILAYIKPDLQFGTWEALGASGALNLDGPLGLYIARNLATALMGIYALTRKSNAMIELLLVLRISTDALDGFHNLIAGNMPSAAFAIVMLLIEIYAYTRINKFQQNKKDPT